MYDPDYRRRDLNLTRIKDITYLFVSSHFLTWLRECDTCSKMTPKLTFRGWLRKRTLGGITSKPHAIVQHLLKNGANAGAIETEGMTPLYWAAKSGHLTVVQVLIS